MKSEEIIEIWDWDTEEPTGKGIERSIAHKKGIPHEGVHLWILRKLENRTEIIFQKRSKDKEQYPGYLDISVGGHVPFGLKTDKLQKEAFEELGIYPETEKTLDLGYYKYCEKIPDLYFYHREFQHVYLLVDNRSLDRYKFNDGEVEAVCAVGVDDFKKLFKEEINLDVEYFTKGNIERKIVNKSDFHPLFFTKPMKKYLDIIFNHIEFV